MHEQSGEFLAYAEPRSAAVLVTQILITRVTSRPLTLEEIRSHGIIVDGSSTRAYNFTFDFGVEGTTFDYNVPILFWYLKDHFGIRASACWVTPPAARASARSRWRRSL